MRVIFLNYKKHFMYRSTVDGNCLYSSCSMLLAGNESINTFLTTAVFFGLLLHVDYYEKMNYITLKINENHEHFIFSFPFLKEAAELRSNKLKRDSSQHEFV